MEPYEEYINAAGPLDDWYHTSRIQHINEILKGIVSEKRVYEVGSRSGIFSYLAYVNGAKSIVGVEQDRTMVKSARKAFKMMGVPKEKFRFSVGDVRTAKVKYDVVLYIGLFYNIPDHENLLRQYHNAELILVECWPWQYGINWVTSTKTKTVGNDAGKTLRCTQYFSSQERLEEVFDNSGFDFERLEDWNGDKFYGDQFYLLKPTRKPNPSLVWGAKVPTHPMKFL